MGTNYYLYTKSKCPTCGHQQEPLHIGKSSAGWCFALHVYPELGINDLKDWGWTKDEDDAGLYEIKNEYGAIITPLEMLRKIVVRAENATRHKVDGEHCIGHGAGTWDLMVGEFS